MQKINKPYTTIWERASDEFIERRSRFIGTILPVTTEEQAAAFINEMKTKYWDARHNVYAYLLREGGISRFSDDGEPSGTGGNPMLEVLRRENVTDVAVVATRYFGGVLLGAGGLTRAYAHTAKIALDAARRKEMVYCAHLVFCVDYDFYGKLMYLLPRHEGTVLSSEFGEKVTLTVLIAMEGVHGLEKAVTEASAGQVTFTLSKEGYDCLEERSSV